MAKRMVSAVQRRINNVTGVGSAGTRRRESNKVLSQLRESMAASAR